MDAKVFVATIAGCCTAVAVAVAGVGVVTVAPSKTVSAFAVFVTAPASMSACVTV